MPLVRTWGGVTLAYRKSMQDSPAYRLNHEEVIKALEEGIAFAENLSPVEAVPDEHGAVKAMLFERQGVKDGKWIATGEIVELPARTRAASPRARARTRSTRRSTRARSRSSSEGRFFQPYQASSRTAPCVLEAGPAAGPVLHARTRRTA